jgi:hypothetical protein
MTEARVSAILKAHDPKVLAAGGSLGPDGLDVEITVPEGVDLVRASLSLEAPDDDETIDIVKTAAIAASSGKNDFKDAEVEWISLDWGARRPIVLLNVTAKGGGKDDPRRGRLKVAEGGPWFPPLPFEVVQLGKAIHLPGITATRLLIEIVKVAGEKLETSSAVIESIAARVAARPPNLKASIDSREPFFEHPLLLGPGEALVLRDELTGALRNAWPANRRGGKVVVTLRCSAAALLRRVDLSITTSLVLSTWSGAGGSKTLSIAAGESALARIDVPAQKPIASIGFTVRRTLRKEVVALFPRPRADPPVAHHVGSGFGAAQAFSVRMPSAALTGLDLYLSPLTRTAKGTVTLYPDAFGRPADVPIKGGSAEIAIKENGALRVARWMSIDFAADVPVADQVFWAVLDFTEGDALWLLDEAPLPEAAAKAMPCGALFRSSPGDPFRAREIPGSFISVMKRPWACARLRFRAESEPPWPTVTLKRGDATLAAAIDDSGRVALDAKALAALPPIPDGSPSSVGVLVRSDVAAEVTLADLRVMIAEDQVDQALFPLSPAMK